MVSNQSVGGSSNVNYIYIYIGAYTKSLVFNFCLDSKIYMTKLHVYKCYLFTNFHFNKN